MKKPHSIIKKLVLLFIFYSQITAIAESLPTLSEIEQSGTAPSKIQATGKRESLEPKVNGILEGKARYYHPNGQLYGIIEYHEGKKTGVHTLFREDGSKEQQLSYKNGQTDGVCLWFDSKGEPWMEALYENGTVKSKKYLRSAEKNMAAAVTDPNRKITCGTLGGAVANRNIEMVKACLKAKADPNSKFAGNPVLTDALVWGLSDIAKILLEAGADPNAKTEDGKPILLRLGFGHGARDDDLLEVAKLLLKHKARFEVTADSTQGLVDSLAMRKFPKTLDFVLKQLPKADLNHALEMALEYGDLDSINILLKQGANPNLEKVIWKAMHYGPEAHRLALIRSKKFDKKSSLWAQVAAIEGRVETLQELLKVGADISSPCEGNRTALILAIEKDKNEVAKILIAAGAKTETLSESGYGSLSGETALCLASRKGNLEIVKSLIAAKADVNATCNSVEAATKGGYTPIVEVLVTAGADLKDRYTGHWRALFTAAELDRKEIGEILIKGGVRIDVRDEVDSTPLMIAASKGSLDMIRLLVKNGASLEATNSRRPINDFGSNFIGTPLGWALEHKQQAAAALLKELGAQK